VVILRITYTNLSMWPIIVTGTGIGTGVVMLIRIKVADPFLW